MTKQKKKKNSMPILWNILQQMKRSYILQIEANNDLGFTI